MSISLSQLLLTIEDLPQITQQTKWSKTKPGPAERGAWSNPIETLEVWFDDENTRGGLRQVILRYADVTDAKTVWPTLLTQRLDRAQTRYELVSLLVERDLPQLQADEVAVRCEDYGPKAGEPNCAIRLRYKFVYVQIMSEIGNRGINKEMFLKLASVVDEQMRPVWEQ